MNNAAPPRNPPSEAIDSLSVNSDQEPHMRVPAPQARALARGAKRELRVPVDTRLTARPLRPATRTSSKPFAPNAGDLIPIHGGQYHTDPETGRRKWKTTNTVYATIDQLERTTLGHLTPEQARAEGHATAEEFEIAFMERIEPAWLDKQERFLREAGSPEHEIADTRDAWALIGYRDRWAPREVWVLTLTAVHDLPEFLAPTGNPGGSELGYVHSAAGAIDDAPRTPVALLKPRWQKKAEERYIDARRQEERVRQAKQLGRRLRSAKLRTPDAPELAVIEAHLTQLEARHSQAA